MTSISSRQKFDDYFMRIAHEVATLATCDRKHVGAVLVKDRTILATGYNGSIAGMAHCDQAGHLMEDGHCVRTVHAEMNAILQAAKNGVSISEAEIYITASPCWPCFKAIANAGIKKIYYGEFYRDERIFEAAKQIGIDLIHLKPEAATLVNGTVKCAKCKEHDASYDLKGVGCVCEICLIEKAKEVGYYLVFKPIAPYPR